MVVWFKAIDIFVQKTEDWAWYWTFKGGTIKSNYKNYNGLYAHHKCSALILFWRAKITCRKFHGINSSYRVKQNDYTKPLVNILRTIWSLNK